MKETVVLISDWADFQEEYPGSGLDQFYTHQYLKINNPIDANGDHASGTAASEAGSQLLRVINRISAAFGIYMRMAFKDLPLATDQFNFLAALYVSGECNKTTVTNYAMMEMSTGSDILKRLLKQGYITQRNDPDDKRSRLINITKKGEVIVKTCFARNTEIRNFMLSSLTESDKKNITTLLKPIEERNANLAIAYKQGTFADLKAKEL
ncbi:MAG: MarR family transcriptional regulator [Ginsengibacter sp.]